MKITFLGTGTSNGIPFIACDCKVCTSTDVHNKRLRTSVLIQNNERNVLIDASSDFRQQALRHNIRDLEAILITHIHADHVFGLDEMRRYNQKYKKRIRVYIKPEFDQELKRVFKYIYDGPIQTGGGVALLDNHQIEPYKTFELNGMQVTPLIIQHGILPIYGYRINDFAYLTDCSQIPAETYEHLKNLKVLVLGALRKVKHSTHFSVDEAVAEAKKIGAVQTYLTHIGHDLEHSEVNASLPKEIRLAYDGLEVDL